MTAVRPAQDVPMALLARLRVIAPALLGATEPSHGAAETGDAVRDAGAWLETLVREVRRPLSPDRVWLLLVAMSGTFPTYDDVREALRALELTDDVGSAALLLDTCLVDRRADDTESRQIELIEGGVVVDVDQAAKRNYHTGIQQVIRRTMPRWDRDHTVRFAAWTPDDQALRTLTDAESDRVVRWSGRPSGNAEACTDIPRPVLVPWRSVVVVADVPAPRALRRLAAIAEISGNRLTAIGYDAIPVVNTHLVPIGAAEHHARYLAMAKHAHRIGAISTTAEAEFRGFIEMLPAQGLQGPLVFECVLPAERGDLVPHPVSTAAVPTVLSVGSLEPRKNHLAVLHAAERLWREGHVFVLRFIGGNRWGDEITAVITELQQAGRPVHVDVGVDEIELHRALSTARFTVFASLHEGYGLPVAESLSFGTPVITSSFGSTAEIARGGGAILIDPRDDEALVDAMRTLLVDDDVIQRLRSEISARSHRSWDEYAAELWERLIKPELDNLQLRPVA